MTENDITITPWGPGFNIDLPRFAVNASAVGWTSIVLTHEETMALYTKLGLALYGQRPTHSEGEGT